MITQFASGQFASGDRFAAGKAAGITGRRGRAMSPRVMPMLMTHLTGTSGPFIRRASLLNERRRHQKNASPATSVAIGARALY